MSRLDQLWTYITDNAAALGVVATAMSVIIALLAWWWPRRTDLPPSRNETVHGPKVGGDVGGDAVGRDKTAVQGDQVGRDQHIHGHKITAEQVIIRQSGEGAPKVTMSVASRFQLPVRNPEFEGRRDKIEEIEAALRAGGAQVTALEGMGGIGKTDTAVEAVHDLVDEGRFKDAQLFLDVQGFSAASLPLAPADALRALLRAFITRQETLPESEHDLAARFREETRGLEILLFLDNVRDEAQIRSLLPGHPGCAVVITSRNRLSLHGLMPIDLAAMDPVEATDLALRLANRRNPARIERVQAERIARLCGHLPLAIEVTANGLSVSAGASVESYLERLEQRAKPLAALERVKSTLELSLQTLDATSRERWPALGVMPSAFERNATRAIWRTENPGPTLEMLEQRSLVSYQANTDTYHIHDILQAIALDELSRTPHKKEQLTQSYQDYLFNLIDSTESIETLGIETLRFAQGMFEDQLNRYKSSSFTRYLTPFIQYYFCVRSIKHRLAYCFWSLGLVYRERGMHSAALDQFERAVSISTELRDQNSIARYSLDLSRAYLMHGEPDRALETIELGANQRGQDAQGFEPLFAWQLCYLGHHYVRCSRLDDAETALGKALAMRMSPLGRPYALYLLGRVHLDRGRRRKGVECLEQSLELYRVVDIGGGNIRMCEELLRQAAADPRPEPTA